MPSRKTERRTASHTRNPKRGGRGRAAASPAAAQVAKSSARSTASGPAHPDPSAVSDAATAKMAGTETVASSFPFNAAKPSEFGKASAQPAVGQAVEPPDPMVTRQHAQRVERVGKGWQRQSTDGIQPGQCLARPRAR